MLDYLEHFWLHIAKMLGSDWLRLQGNMHYFMCNKKSDARWLQDWYVGLNVAPVYVGFTFRQGGSSSFRSTGPGFISPAIGQIA